MAGGGWGAEGDRAVGASYEGGGCLGTASVGVDMFILHHGQPAHSQNQNLALTHPAN